MLGSIMLLAASLQSPEVQPPEAPPIDVTGTPVCRRVNLESANSRLGTRRVCMTRREWDRVREDNIAFLLDMPRRNARSGTMPTALEAAAAR